MEPTGAVPVGVLRLAAGDADDAGQRQDEGAVELLRVGGEERLDFAGLARVARLHLGRAQQTDQPQRRVLHAQRQLNLLPVKKKFPPLVATNQRTLC